MGVQEMPNGGHYELHNSMMKERSTIPAITHLTAIQCLERSTYTVMVR